MIDTAVLLTHQVIAPDNSTLCSYPAALNWSTPGYSPRKCTCSCVLGTCLSVTATGLRACARLDARAYGICTHAHTYTQQPLAHFTPAVQLRLLGPSLAPFVNYIKLHNVHVTDKTYTLNSTHTHTSITLWQYTSVIVSIGWNCIAIH